MSISSPDGLSPIYISTPNCTDDEMNQSMQLLVNREDETYEDLFIFTREDSLGEDALIDAINDLTIEEMDSLGILFDQ